VLIAPYDIGGMATSKTTSPSGKKHRIAVIGGDGIGPEVVQEALKVLRAAGAQLETTDFDLGGARFLRDGEVLSDATLCCWHAWRSAGCD
jgi:isocitrate/isopropylmalate dehydrogenase